MSYEGMSTGSGGYTPAKDGNTIYPEYPMDVLTQTYQDKDLKKMLNLTNRSSFQSTQTQGMIAFISLRSTDFHTEQDKFMISNPNTKLREEGISRNHKLADSSIRAIMVGLWRQLKNQPFCTFDPASQEIVMKFFKAMLVNPDDAKEVLKLLQDAAVAETVHKAVGPLGKGIQKLSVSYNNLRFGNAKLNERILFAFDPNVKTNRDASPLSKEIITAGKNLVKILPAEVIGNAFQQAVDKTTGKEITSTILQHLGNN